MARLASRLFAKRDCVMAPVNPYGKYGVLCVFLQCVSCRVISYPRSIRDNFVRFLQLHLSCSFFPTDLQAFSKCRLRQGVLTSHVAADPERAVCV